jgi:MFS family permease
MPEAVDASIATVPVAEPHPQPLSRNRDFVVVLATQSISALGDAITFTALPLLVLALTGSGLAMGVVGAIQVVADVAVAMVAGVVADRSDRKRMMLLADFGRAILTALIPLSILLGGPTMAVIVLVVGPMSVLRAFFMAGYIASVPALVGRPLIGRANGYFEAVYSVSFIIGPAVAGILATTIGPGPTLAIDAVSFAISAAGLLLVRRDLRAPIDRVRGRFTTEIRDGIDYIVQHPVLRAAILFWSAVSALLAPLVTALAVMVTRDLGLPPAVLGLILTGYGAGTVVGSLLTTRRASGRRIAPMLLGGNVLMGISLVIMATVDTVPALVGVAFLAGVAQMLVALTYITARTAYSPDELLGRIASTARTASLGLQPVGMLVGGALVDLTAGSTVIGLMGIALCGVSVVFVPVKVLRTASLQPR